MEQGDLYVRVSLPRRTRQLELLYRWIGIDGEVQERRSPGEPALSADAPTAALADAVVGALAGLLAEQAALPPRTLLLEIDPKASVLFGVDWEAELRRPPLPAWDITRFIDRSDPWLGIPFELPARVLRAGGFAPMLFRASHAERSYFRLHRLSGCDDRDLLETLEHGRFDIVHLGVRGTRDATTGEAALSIAAPAAEGDAGLGARGLSSALRAAHVRLLLLECSTATDYEALLELAQRLQHAGGPATALFQSLPTADLGSLYMDIVHDLPLDAAVARAGVSAVRRAFFCAIGGASVLSIEPIERRLKEIAARAAQSVQTLEQARLHERPLAQGGLGGGPDAVDELKRRADALMNRVYYSTSESGAWIPMAGDGREAAGLRDDVDAALAERARVFNVGLLRDGRSLDSREAVSTSTSCELAMQVARSTAWSLVREAPAFPEQVVAGHYRDGGLPLRVVITARGFDLATQETTLLLRPPPADSELVKVALRSPAQPGRYRIRVGLYHENNLLQSVLLRVDVNAPGAARRRGAGLHAEVEFALSESLADPQRLPQRTVNVLCNAGDDGSHTFLVVGAGFRKDFDFGEGQMRAAVDDARKALLEIAADRSGARPRYRFDADNRGSLAQLGPDLIRLAEHGHAMFSSIVTAEDRAFKAQLLAALGPSLATIQVSATKSARYVFPWALVYDRPLVVGGNRLCPQFAADVLGQAPLEVAQCFNGGCPHLGDASVVCPSGFWGFKHLLEQPMSVKAKAGPIGAGELVTELHVGPAGAPLPALMAISRELDQVVPHEREMRGEAAWQFAVKDTKAEVLLNLQAAAQAHVPLVYFYCHGGRAGSQTWLGIGRGERLVPGDLEAREIDWSGASPLVMINGCHTADLTPDDLLSFNQVLAWCRAAGVIGTEIDVTESLARDFARGFFAQLAGGAAVGESIRRQRLSLLARFNPLGLAYTPYCSASLRFIHH